MMESTHVIRRPILTEKSTFGMNEQARYAFEVDRRATKDDVKAAVERIYGVKVIGVATQVRKGKLRRLRYGWVQERTSKKAVVRLKEGDVIELF
ncbi:MAG: 50S ribosomal protein L23 [Phycisphaerales bacterium]|nr:MAG: 50S ribosomal protein L23 [Phycisphaerales bacterium]